MSTFNIEYSMHHFALENSIKMSYGAGILLRIALQNRLRSD